MPFGESPALLAATDMITVLAGFHGTRDLARALIERRNELRQ